MPLTYCADCCNVYKHIKIHRDSKKHANHVEENYPINLTRAELDALRRIIFAMPMKTKQERIGIIEKLKKKLNQELFF